MGKNKTNYSSNKWSNLLSMAMIVYSMYLTTELYHLKSEVRSLKYQLHHHSQAAGNLEQDRLLNVTGVPTEVNTFQISQKVIVTVPEHDKSSKEDVSATNSGAGNIVSETVGKNDTISVPHGHYFKNIPTSPENPNTPLDQEKEYTYDDFESVFNIKPIHETVTDPAIEDLLNSHDVYTDAYWLQDVEYSKSVSKQTQHFFDKSIEERIKAETDHMVVKWSSAETGFGLHAIADIPQGSILGEYCGVINKDQKNTDYMWEYDTRKINGKSVNLGVDSLKMGNYFRFVNHVDDPNCMTIATVRDNRWVTLYVSKKPIKKGEEITISYGTQYFAHRANKVA
ncbi:hypothetical protein BC833DRAFT_97039 [Globomyces pollinis-pini]|nr:hypothetical protein BC833DRAFT_97039 [Globomyces pollinis-pini]